MIKGRLSLRTIINISSFLMVVLLASDIHSLAAQIEDLSKSSHKEVQKNTQKDDGNSKNNKEKKEELPDDIDRVPTTSKTSFMNQMQGWTPEKGIDTDKTSSSKTEEDESDVDSRVQLAENSLHSDVDAQQQNIQNHAAQLAMQQKQLAEEQKNFNTELQALEKNNSELSSEQEKRKEDIEAGIMRMAHVYEQMPPRDAAGMFNVLDMRVMVPVAQHMNPRKVSDIIGNMDPDRANILSQYLAGVRQLSADTINRLNTPTDYPVR